MLKLHWNHVPFKSLVVCGPWGRKKGKNEKDVYNITKELGVKYTKAIINDKDNKYLDKYKKKDDLCDAFLQAIKVYYNDNIPKDIANKFRITKTSFKYFY